MKNIIKNVALAATISTTSLSVVATELVYTPINPSFGGSPLNGSFLLNKANSQNDHSAPSNVRTSADRLQESLERAYINRIVREVTDLAFNEQTLDADGNPIQSIFDEDSLFQSGDFQVQLITSNPDSLVVEITDIVTGEVTIVEIPRFG